jgi:RecA/RadA recombinase
VMFGNPETTTGGRALKFYASVRVDVRRIASIKDGDEIVGNRTKAKIVKNKVRHRFERPNSTLCTDWGSPARVTFWMLPWKRTSSTRAAPGSHSRENDSARDGTMPAVPQGQPRLPRPHRTRASGNHGTGNSDSAPVVSAASASSDNGQTAKKK